MIPTTSSTDPIRQSPSPEPSPKAGDDGNTGVSDRAETDAPIAEVTADSIGHTETRAMAYASPRNGGHRGAGGVADVRQWRASKPFGMRLGILWSALLLVFIPGMQTAYGLAIWGVQVQLIEPGLASGSSLGGIAGTQFFVQAAIFGAYSVLLLLMWFSHWPPLRVIYILATTIFSLLFVLVIVQAMVSSAGADSAEVGTLLVRVGYMALLIGLCAYTLWFFRRDSVRQFYWL